VQKIKMTLVVATMAVAFAIPFNVKAQASNVSIIDDADLLSSSEESELEEYLESLDDSINYVAVTTSSSETGYNTDSRLEHYYGLNYSTYEDGIAFIIDMVDRKVYMSGYGDIQDKLTSADATDITDNVYSYASDQDYYECMVNAFIQADTLVNKGFIARPMRIIVTGMLSVILGFLGCFYYGMSARTGNKKAVDKATSVLMPVGAMTAASAVYKTRKVRHVESSSDGGGGFSGGGGGGGGHSGGGHSF